jgi:CheY-like chemotaxis protein
LVEDNELNIEVAEELLDVIGLEVEMAHNGKEAVDKLFNAPDDYYDLVFMDIQMPVMNGYEATTAIRASERGYLQEIPIIAMTADAFEEDIKRALECGMDGHMSKPIDIAKLEKTIEEFI